MKLSEKEIKQLVLEICQGIEEKKDPHTAKWKRCHKSVEADSIKDGMKPKNAATKAAKICTSSIGYDDSIKEKSQKHEGEENLDEGVGKSHTVKRGKNVKVNKKKLKETISEVKRLVNEEKMDVKKIKEHLQELKLIQEMMGVSLTVKKQAGGQPENMKEDE